jgi:hypothetical protein
VINEAWKIYQYISKSERLNTAFCEDNDEEVVIDSGENVFEDEAQATDELSENVATDELSETATTYVAQSTYEYDQHSNESEISFINPVYEYENNEYESIYTWLVTPQLHELKKAEEMKELCRWLSTSFWERT